MKRLSTFLLLCTAAAMVAGCVQEPELPVSMAVPPEVLTSAHRYQIEYILSAGDQLDISVTNLPEFSRTVIIRPDNKITLPRIGDVLLGGYTASEATAALTSKLAERVIDPEVTIAVNNPREQVVFVVGEVGRPNFVSMRSARTVAEAVSVAGGTNRSASINRIALIRLGEDGRLTAHIVNNRQVAGTTGAYLSMQTIPLQANDIIVVPESNRSKFVRAVQDFINSPLGTVNQLLTPYIQFRLLQEIN